MFSITQCAEAPDVWILAGRLDNSTAGQLEEKAPVLAAQRLVVLDMGGVEYVSSAGLRAILQALKRIQAAGGRLHLAAAQPAVREIFEISGFLSILPMFPDVAAAAS